MLDDTQAERVRQIAEDLVAVAAYPTVEDAVEAVVSALTAGPPIVIGPRCPASGQVAWSGRISATNPDIAQCGHCRAVQCLTDGCYVEHNFGECFPGHC